MTPRDLWTIRGAPPWLHHDFLAHWPHALMGTNQDGSITVALAIPEDQQTVSFRRVLCPADGDAPVRTETVTFLLDHERREMSR